jgi:hypothetical protein
MFDEVVCNHELFGVHRGETHQTKDLHCLGGLLDLYEIPPSGRLEFLEFTVEDRSDPTLQGIERFFGKWTRVFTGGRRDLNYHGWLYLSSFGRAKFTDGTMVAFEPEPNRRINSEDRLEVGKESDATEQSGVVESDPIFPNEHSYRMYGPIFWYVARHLPETVARVRRRRFEQLVDALMQLKLFQDQNPRRPKRRHI